MASGDISSRDCRKKNDKNKAWRHRHAQHEQKHRKTGAGKRASSPVTDFTTIKECLKCFNELFYNTPWKIQEMKTRFNKLADQIIDDGYGNECIDILEQLDWVLYTPERAGKAHKMVNRLNKRIFELDIKHSMPTVPFSKIDIIEARSMYCYLYSEVKTIESVIPDITSVNFALETMRQLCSKYKGFINFVEILVPIHCLSWGLQNEDTDLMHREYQATLKKLSDFDTEIKKYEKASSVITQSEVDTYITDGRMGRVKPWQYAGIKRECELDGIYLPPYDKVNKRVGLPTKVLPSLYLFLGFQKPQSPMEEYNILISEAYKKLRAKKYRSLHPDTSGKSEVNLFWLEVLKQADMLLKKRVKVLKSKYPYLVKSEYRDRTAQEMLKPERKETEVQYIEGGE